MSIHLFELRPGAVRGPRTLRRRRWKPANAVSGAAALAFALFAGPLSAQTGTISGVLTNGETGEPLSNVQISLEGTGLGTLTNNQGRFLILNAPAGEREVVAQLIGFREERRTVSLGSGESALADMSMYPLAVELEGVVVTGTAIAAQKREVGNSISLVTSDELLYAGAINLEDALRGRALGVSITGASGTAGAGSDILLRGTNSVNGRNRPLIYVDGVRMPTGTLEDASGEAQEHATFLGSIREEDIERIEIIKGPAASSLYGTDASAGVIQIFTKKGSPGAPRWTMNMQQGLQRVGHVGPSLDPTGLRVNDCTRQFNHSLEEGYHFNRDESGTLIADPGCPASGTWLRDAHVQDYSLSVRGGSEEVTYYASAGYGITEGVIDPNESEDVNVRANFTFSGFENFQINLNNFYTRRDIAWIPNGDNSEGLLYNVARGDEGETPDNDDSAVLDLTQDQTINHFNSSANVDWTPMDNMRHRLTFGLDYSNSHYITQRPWLFWNNPLGTRTVDIENRRVITLDYAGTYLFELPGNFTSTTSAGAQYNQFEHLGNRTDVEGFIGPGAKVLENAEEVTNYNEDRDATEGGGFFIQEQIGWRNRLFVNVGLRADTHSSFGREYTKDVRFTMYPKAQATYTLSDHEFWPSWWETFRLRGAYGESGEAPPADASVTIFEASSLADENNLGFIIDNLANLRVGPERAKEFEGGFDASLFDGILALNGTAYYRRTFDGLINVAPAPSSGEEILEYRNYADRPGNSAWTQLHEAAWAGYYGVEITTRVFAEEGLTNHPLTARSWIISGWAERMMGELFCESVFNYGPGAGALIGPNDQYDPSRSVDTDSIMRRSLNAMQNALTVAEAAVAAGAPTPDGDERIFDPVKLMFAAHGGIAQAAMLMGDWDLALSHAAQVPDDFILYSHSHPEVEDNGWFDVSFQNDDFTLWNTPVHRVFHDDPRVPWIKCGEWRSDTLRTRHGSSRDIRDTGLCDRTTGYGGEYRAESNRMPLYSSLKSETEGLLTRPGGETGEDADFPMVRGTEMLLIRAEKALLDGNLGQFTTLVNRARAVYGMDPIEAPTSAGALEYPNAQDDAWSILDRERYVLMHLEGRRFADMRRWQHPYIAESHAINPRVESENGPARVVYCMPIADIECDANADFNCPGVG